VAELDDVVEQHERLLDFAPVLGLAVEPRPQVLHDDVLVAPVLRALRYLLQVLGRHVPLLIRRRFV